MSREKFSLNDKTALVIGGRGCLGRQFTAALAESGARVYSADISDAVAMDRESGVPAEAFDVRNCFVDVTRVDSIKNLIEEIMDERHGIDILVYSVTTKPDDFYLPFTHCSLSGWQQILQVELDGLFLTAQQVGRVMESQQSGAMIFLASIYGLVGNDQRIYQDANLAEIYTADSTQKPKHIYAHAGYAAVKGAVISMTRYLATYWADAGIRVNCISPGGVMHPAENESFVRRYSARTPMGRKADPDEMNGAIVYLASDASSYVTGQNLVVDGGWTAW